MIKRIRKARATGEDRVQFTITVRVGGSYHMEVYSFPIKYYKDVQKMGLDKERYFDWKPLFMNDDDYNPKTFKGGLYEVSAYTKDEKYTYAWVDKLNTTKPSFAIRNDVFAHHGERDIILVAKRESFGRAKRAGS